MSELRDRVAERLWEARYGKVEPGFARYDGEAAWNMDTDPKNWLTVADEVLRIVAWNRARGNKPTTLPPGDWKP